MWVFASSGMAMPALIPPSVLREAKTKEIQEAVANGWELQVRGRVRKHLQYWCDTFMPEGTFSKVYASPGKDYNFRFYTTREAYGESLKQQALNIDYVKFKSTSLSFPWGKPYHDLLLRVWGASTMLGRPYAGAKKSARMEDHWFSSSEDFLFSEPGSAKARRRGNPRKLKRDQEFYNDLWSDTDNMGGVDDLPYEFTHGEGRHRSIHELSDDELERMFNG
jgi:hypothetical protein